MSYPTPDVGAIRESPLQHIVSVRKSYLRNAICSLRVFGYPLRLRSCHQPVLLLWELLESSIFWAIISCTFVKSDRAQCLLGRIAPFLLLPIANRQ